MASLRAYFGAWTVRRRVKVPLSAAKSVEDVRRILGGPGFPDPTDVTFTPGTMGGIPGEWIRPQAGATHQRLLYVHGGGFVACSPKTHRPLTGAWARRGFEVFAPDYRLAPENPFPAGLEDVIAAWTAFRAEGPAALAGESAGGNLALALLLAARDRGIPLPSAACLFSPVTDLAEEGGSRISNGRRDAMFGARSIPRSARSTSARETSAIPSPPPSTAIFAACLRCCSMSASGRCCGTIPSAWPSGPRPPGSR